MQTPKLSSSILLLIFLVLPRSEAGITVGTLSIEKKANPGESYEGTLTLTNDGNRLQKVAVYQTDYLCFSDGSNQFGVAGELKKSNADWITFNPNQIEVPPHQSSWINYEVRVPDDSSLIGTYWSLLMVEEVPELQDSLNNLKHNQTGIRHVVRYGIQCITHIGDTGHHGLNFTGTRLVKGESHQKELQVDVENIGERWAMPTAWIELYDISGRRVGRFESEKKRIFPGASVRFRINLSDAPSGKYKTLIVLDTGDQNVLGAKYDLEF